MKLYKNYKNLDKNPSLFKLRSSSKNQSLDTIYVATTSTYR